MKNTLEKRLTDIFSGTTPLNDINGPTTNPVPSGWRVVGTLNDPVTRALFQQLEQTETEGKNIDHFEMIALMDHQKNMKNFAYLFGEAATNELPVIHTDGPAIVCKDWQVAMKDGTANGPVLDEKSLSRQVFSQIKSAFTSSPEGPFDGPEGEIEENDTKLGTVTNPRIKALYCLNKKLNQERQELIPKFADEAAEKDWYESQSIKTLKAFKAKSDILQAQRDALTMLYMTIVAEDLPPEVIIPVRESGMGLGLRKDWTVVSYPAPHSHIFGPNSLLSALLMSRIFGEEE